MARQCASLLPPHTRQPSCGPPSTRRGHDGALPSPPSNAFAAPPRPPAQPLVPLSHAAAAASSPAAPRRSLHQSIAAEAPFPTDCPKQRGGRPSNQSPTAVRGGAQPRTFTRCRAPRTPPASPLTAAAARLSRAARHVTRSAAGDKGISQRNGFAPRARARGGTSKLSGAVLPPPPFRCPRPYNDLRCAPTAVVAGDMAARQRRHKR